jgi:hypothetical protein
VTRSAVVKTAAYSAVLSALLAVGCSSDSATGTGEPFRVRAPSGSPSAQFIAGDLPGAPPLDPTTPPATAEDGGTVTEAAPAILNIQGPRTPFAGQGDVAFQGAASPSAASVGLRLDGFGSGYWVVPTGIPDPLTLDAVWNVRADFGLSVPPGLHDLLVVAFDDQGTAGRQTAKSLCVASQVPDNFNYCESSATPPAAVISLDWDTPADLDLQVQTPDGVFVTAKHPVTTSPEAGAPSSTDGKIDRDANAACRGGIRQENLVWQTDKPHGGFQIFANLFDACKQPAVRFHVHVYTAIADDDGTQRLVEQYQRAGELLEFQANGGANRGLYIATYTFR